MKSTLTNATEFVLRNPRLQGLHLSKGVLLPFYLTVYKVRAKRE